MTAIPTQHAFTPPAPALPPVPVSYRQLIVDDTHDDIARTIVSLVSDVPLKIAATRTPYRGGLQ
jgi:hypothetical protein